MKAITMTNVCLKILFRTSDCFLERFRDAPVATDIEKLTPPIADDLPDGIASDTLSPSITIALPVGESIDPLDVILLFCFN